MSVDLKGMTPKQLERLATDVAKEIARRDTKQRDAALKAAAKAAKQHGFDLGDLLGQAPKKRGPKKKPAPAKYRNPDNPEQTWSGRGRRPEWFKAAEKAGKPLASLEI